jgi:hypothetical protein
LFVPWSTHERKLLKDYPLCSSSWDTDFFVAIYLFWNRRLIIFKQRLYWQMDSHSIVDYFHPQSVCYTDEITKIDSNIGSTKRIFIQIISVSHIQMYSTAVSDHPKRGYFTVLSSHEHTCKIFQRLLYTIHSQADESDRFS